FAVVGFLCGRPASQSPTLAFHGSDFLGLEVRRQNDLQHFDVFAVSNLAMANLRRLMHAGPCLEPNSTLTFIFKLDPTLEDIYELKGRIVKVRLAREVGTGCCTNDVGNNASCGSVLDPKIAVLVERAETALEGGVLGMGYDETLHRHVFAPVGGAPVQQACASWTGGHLTEPNEQKTQQSPGRGRSRVPQP